MGPPVATVEEAISRLEPDADAIRALGVERLALFGSVVLGRACALHGGHRSPTRCLMACSSVAACAA
jgi:hypothetical protein